MTLVMFVNQNAVGYLASAANVAAGYGTQEGLELVQVPVEFAQVTVVGHVLGVCENREGDSARASLGLVHFLQGPGGLFPQGNLQVVLDTKKGFTFDFGANL